jgi:hypothetical protein
MVYEKILYIHDAKGGQRHLTNVYGGGKSRVSVAVYVLTSMVLAVR